MNPTSRLMMVGLDRLMISSRSNILGVAKPVGRLMCLQYAKNSTMVRLDGKVCIITGATSGIGEKVVEVFLKEGSTVVFSGRRSHLGKSIQDRLGGHFVRCDVSIESDVVSLIETTISTFGRIDCFFANAGAGGPQGGIAS